jgi:hypothetical protein
MIPKVSWPLRALSSATAPLASSRFDLGVALRMILGWDRKMDQYPEGSVENLKNVITGQAAILALRSIDGSQADAPIAGAAVGTDNVGCPHHLNMRSVWGIIRYTVIAAIGLRER